MDNLEKFIENNRKAFDDKQPSDKVWGRINPKLPKNNINMWWKVAAIIFFVSTVTLVHQNYFTSNVSANELAELESFYFEQIDYKQSLVYNSHEIDMESAIGLEEDLQKLDAMYKVLKEEWQKRPSKEVLEALTLNLIVRIDILNRQLQAIEKPETPTERSI